MSLAAGLERPQGVDLDLNKFDLSTTHRVEKASEASWTKDVANFWEKLDAGAFPAEELQLLRSIFNPNLSDRREDGDLFLPPDAAFSHVKKLQTLTKSEDVVRAERQALFFSDSSASLKARPEFVNQALFDKVSATPTFEKSYEDGVCFRVYKFGSIEMRTTQEHNGKEIVGAAFQDAKTDDLKSYIYAQVQNM